MDNLGLPRFDKGKVGHPGLSELSEKWEDAARKSDQDRLAAMGQQLDKAAAKLWGITDDQVKAIQESLTETGKSKRAEEESTDSADDAHE